MIMHAYQHVVVVVEENHGFDQVMASGAAPFIQKLAGEGLLFTRYKAVGHPSQPNYLALFSGSTHGVTDNKARFFDFPTLAGQLRGAGYTFTGYVEEGSPRKHNPWESFVDSQDAGQDMARFPAAFDRLPTVSFVVPNLRHDMHDGTIREGDEWLEQTVGAYAEWAKTHDSLLIVTFDEAFGDGPVPTIIVGEGVHPGRTGQDANHYSLLGLIESLYGLPQLADVPRAPVIHVEPDTDPSGQSLQRQ